MGNIVVVHESRSDFHGVVDPSSWGGMISSAIARVLRASVSTVTCRLEKAGWQAQAFSEEQSKMTELFGTSMK
jgi:hypothetical protein